MPNRSRRGDDRRPGPGRGAYQGEPLQPVPVRPGMDAPVEYEVHREVFHGRVEELLHDLRYPVYLVDKEDVALLHVGEEAHQVPALLEGRPRRGDDLRVHLVRDDVGERGLSEARRPVQKDMLQRLPPLERRLYRYPQGLDGFVLPDVFGQRLRPQVEEVLFVGGLFLFRACEFVRLVLYHFFWPL